MEFDIPEAVVLLIDARDAVGRALFEFIAGKPMDTAWIADFERHHRIPTLTIPMALDTARNVMSCVAPDACNELMKPIPPDFYWVLVIASGGTTCIARPMPRPNGQSQSEVAE